MNKDITIDWTKPVENVIFGYKSVTIIADDQVATCSEDTVVEIESGSDRRVIPIKEIEVGDVITQFT